MKTNEEKIKEKYIICECGYHNLKEYVKKYGDCNCCKRVLDKKAKLEYEMVCRLRLWKK